MNRIFSYLDELYNDPKCELYFNNDFEFLIAVVLSAQTTDKKVNKVTRDLFKKYDITTLKDADIKEIEIILKPIGIAHNKAKYIIEISRELYYKYNSVVPDNFLELTKLSGVGRKSANLVLSTIYNKPLIAVDTHVSRVSKRLGIALKKDSLLTVEKKLYKVIPKNRLLKTHHQLVLFGRYRCKAIKPMCKNCKLNNICKYEKRNV